MHCCVIIGRERLSSGLDNLAMGIQVVAVVFDAILTHDKAIDLLRGQDKCVGVYVARDDIGAILRIEGANLVDRDVEHLGNLGKMDAPIHAHCVGDEWLAG